MAKSEMNKHSTNPEITFSEFFNQLTEKRNVQYIIIAIVVIVMLSTGFLYLKNKAQARQDLAWFKVGQVIKIYYKPTRSSTMFAQPNQKFEYNSDAEKFNDCISSLNEILPSVTKTPAEPVALYYLGKCYLHIDEFQQAHDTFSAFYQKFPNHFLAPIVLLNNGFTLEDSQNYKEAIEIYKFIDKKYPENISAAYALYHISLCNEEMGEYEKSIEPLNQIVTRFKDYDIFGNASDRIKFLAIHKTIIQGKKEKWDNRVEPKDLNKDETPDNKPEENKPEKEQPEDKEKNK